MLTFPRAAVILQRLSEQLNLAKPVCPNGVKPLSIQILVVEDVPELLEDLGFYLADTGFSVACAGSALAFWAEFEAKRPDIVLLDVGLPCECGLSIAQRVREQYPHIGIVMLTGRSLLTDRLSGRSAGADDYLTKPVQMDELVLVLHNLARRLRLNQPQSWVLEIQALRLSTPSGAQVELTRSEAQVFKALATAPSQQATRQRIVECLGYAWETYDERRLEAIISRLKRKLVAELELDDSPIRSLRGEGYGFIELLRLA
jgi:two-component system OmpR family response regulator